MNIRREIVDKEWEMMQNVDNEGGRAECQDDFETFRIMRSSQFEAWTEEALRAYLKDLEQASVWSRNLIAEKYARMMENSDPQAYAELEPQLPVLSEEQRRLAEEIVSVQVRWREIFAEKYPALSKQARSIYSSEDRITDTSFETYLRGELLTYSFDALISYGQMIAAYAQKGRNITEMIMENTVKYYGYKDLKAAEKATQEEIVGEIRK